MRWRLPSKIFLLKSLLVTLKLNVSSFLITFIVTCGSSGIGAVVAGPYGYESGALRTKY